MIIALEGKIIGLGPSQVHLKVAGITYEVYVPLNTLSKVGGLLRKSDQVDFSLAIYHHFVDNQQRLYGFEDQEQREFFIYLQSIKGCGPSLSLSLLSHQGIHSLLQLCQKEDIQALCRIPRVGKNTAQRLIFEIRQKSKKLKQWQKYLDNTEFIGNTFLTKNQELAVQGLLQLGYNEKQANELITRIEKSGQLKADATASEWIHACLQNS